MSKTRFLKETGFFCSQYKIDTNITGPPSLAYHPFLKNSKSSLITVPSKKPTGIQPTETGIVDIADNLSHHHRNQPFFAKFAKGIHRKNQFLYLGHPHRTKTPKKPPKMNSRILRVYADTTIFGGVFDPEYEKPSRAFFHEVQTGKFRLVTSAVVQNEIETGPPQLKDFYEKTIGLAGIVNLSEDVWKLHQAYLDAQNISPELILDALHVAMATVSECFAIVSWDFKNLVHYKKIRFYNAINLLEGYSQIAIYSPLELISYDGK